MQSTTPSAKARWAGYILSGLVIAFFIFDGAIKLPPLDMVAQASKEFDIPVQFARTLGVILLVCTLLYVIPQTAPLGAILLTAYLGGAVWTHVRIGSPLFSHTLFGVYLGLMIWGGLWLREERVRALIPFRR